MKLRIKMKTWTDPVNGNMYMVASGYFNLAEERMVAYAMRDDEARQLRFTIDEWNDLPYHFFNEDGPAPKPAKSYRPDPVGGSGVIHP